MVSSANMTIVSLPFQSFPLILVFPNSIDQDLHCYNKHLLVGILVFLLILKEMYPKFLEKTCIFAMSLALNI